jgi:hypothetical protein
MSRHGHSNYLHRLNNICIQDYADTSETTEPHVATGGSSHLILLHTKTSVPGHAIRAYRGSRGLDPLSLTPGTMCGSTSLPGRFASRKHPSCAVNTRLDGPQRQWGCFEQKNFLSLREFEIHSPRPSYCSLS